MALFLEGRRSQFRKTRAAEKKNNRGFASATYATGPETVATRINNYQGTEYEDTETSGSAI